jgi:hypothetical protein
MSLESASSIQNADSDDPIVAFSRMPRTFSTASTPSRNGGGFAAMVSSSPVDVELSARRHVPSTSDS